MIRIKYLVGGQKYIIFLNYMSDIRKASLFDYPEVFVGSIDKKMLTEIGKEVFLDEKENCICFLLDVRNLDFLIAIIQHQ